MKNIKSNKLIRHRHLSKRDLSKSSRKFLAKVVSKGGKIAESLCLNSDAYYLVYCEEKGLFFGMNRELLNILDGDTTFCNNLEYIQPSMGSCYVYDIANESILDGLKHRKIKVNNIERMGFYSYIRSYRPSKNNLVASHLALATELMPDCNWKLMNRKTFHKKYIDKA